MTDTGDYESRTITEEEVRRGDLLRVEWVELGAHHTVTATADALSPLGNWVHRHGNRVTLLTGRRYETITLLHRSEPELPTEPGSVVIATKVRGVEGRWTMVLADPQAYDTYRWLSVEEAIESAVGQNRWHAAYQINEWRPARIVVDEEAQ